MAWSTPLTAVSNAILTAAQWNASVRDNLLETAPAKAVSGAGRTFSSDAVNSIVERFPQGATVDTTETTTTTTYTDLTTVGPAITVATGARALVLITAGMRHSAVDGECFTGYDISGATSTAASDARSARFQSGTANQDWKGSAVHFEGGLTPGNNTFTLKYRVSASTGTFENRRVFVFPF